MGHRQAHAHTQRAEARALDAVTKLLICFVFARDAGKKAGWPRTRFPSHHARPAARESSKKNDSLTIFPPQATTALHNQIGHMVLVSCSLLSLPRSLHTRRIITPSSFLAPAPIRYPEALCGHDEPAQPGAGAVLPPEQHPVRVGVHSHRERGAPVPCLQGREPHDAGGGGALVRARTMDTLH